MGGPCWGCGEHWRDSLGRCELGREGEATGDSWILVGGSAVGTAESGKSGPVCKSHAGSAVRDRGTGSGDGLVTYVTVFLCMLGVGRG